MIRCTPSLRACILKLRAEGKSYRAIEEALSQRGTPLSHMSVKKVIDEAAAARPVADSTEADGEPAAGQRKARGGAGRETGSGSGRGRNPSRAPGGYRTGAGDGGGAGTGEGAGEGAGAGGDVGASVDDLEVPLPELPTDAPHAARVLHAELVEVRRVARTVYRQVVLGEFPLSQWVAAKAHVLRLVKALGDELPAPPPDPSRDPTNIACREMTHAQVIRLIRTAQAKRGHLCAVCLERPAEGDS
jgi:hypothetical protein